MLLKNLTLSSSYQTSLEPLNGIDSYTRIHNMFPTSSPFFTLDLVCSFYRHQGYPLRFLVFSLSTAYNIDLKYCNTDSSSLVAPSLLYAPPLFLWFRPLSSSSFLSIILISILTVIYITTWFSYWHNKVHQQPSK